MHSQTQVDDVVPCQMQLDGSQHPLSYEQEVWYEVALLVGIPENLARARAGFEEPRLRAHDPARLRAMLHLTRAITELPTRERFAVVLSYLGDQSITEIGRQLQVSEAGAVELQMRGIGMLRKSLSV